jgi:hypothetical protein
MNKTLQDRLVKELRLRGISDMASANAFAPTFMDDYNRRFGRAPVNPEDAHRPLLPGQDLGSVFTWQVSRRLTRNLVVHYKRRTYLVQPTPEALDLGRRRVQVEVHEAPDGTVVIRFEGKTLPYDVLDKQPLVDAGALVEHKRLGAVLSIIQATQAERDEQRLASKKMTLREKARLRESRDLASAPPLAAPLSRDQRLTAMASFMKRALEEQAVRRKVNNDRSNQRKRDRELELAKRRHSTLTEREDDGIAEASRSG